MRRAASTSASTRTCRSVTVSSTTASDVIDRAKMMSVAIVNPSVAMSGRSRRNAKSMLCSEKNTQLTTRARVTTDTERQARKTRAAIHSDGNDTEIATGNATAVKPAWLAKSIVLATAATPTTTANGCHRSGRERLRATSDARARFTRKTDTNAYVITRAFA